MATPIDLTGQRFGRLVAIKRAGKHVTPSGQVIPLWLCHCDCGVEITKRAGQLRSGHTTSCGCKLREGTNRRHGDTHEPERGGNSAEWNAWRNMRRRCADDPTRREYAYYAGRGIRVCERWLGPDGFSNFLSDVGRKPGPQYTLDRTDNNRGYEPGNVRWVTRSEQNRNKRPTTPEAKAAISEGNRRAWKSGKRKGRNAPRATDETSSVPAPFGERITLPLVG